MKIITAQAAALLLTLGLAAPGAQAMNYTFESYQLPGATATSIYDISHAGVAVGTAQFESATELFSRGFLVNGGVVTEFAGPPGAVSWSLSAVADNGMVLGSFSTSLDDDGTGSGFRVPGPAQLFTYSAGTYRTLSAPANFSVVGMSPNGRWVTGVGDDGLGKGIGTVLDTTLGSVTALDCAADFCVAAGANDAGQVVGYDRTRLVSGGNVGTGWVFDLATGVRTEVAIAGAERVAARDINAQGVIAGYFGDARLLQVHGFVDDGTGVTRVDVPGATSTYIFGADDGGVVVGEYLLDPTGPAFAFIARPVPEPATFGLMVAGLAVLGGAAGRRRPRLQRR